MHRNWYTQKLVHRDRYTQGLVHTGIGTHMDWYTEKLVHRDWYIQKPVHTRSGTYMNWYTGIGTHRNWYIGTGTHRTWYTGTGTHMTRYTGTGTHRNWYTGTGIHGQVHTGQVHTRPAPHREIPPGSPVGAVVGDEDGEGAMVLHGGTVDAVQQPYGHGQLASQCRVACVQLLQTLPTPQGKSDCCLAYSQLVT